jgi:hypothetical protein
MPNSLALGYEFDEVPLSHQMQAHVLLIQQAMAS